MKKILMSGIIALSVIGATSAAEVPSTNLLTTANAGAFSSESTDDLLTIASAGALTSKSAGVYQLSSAEMDEVHGGKFRIRINNLCIGIFWFCK